MLPLNKFIVLSVVCLLLVYQAVCDSNGTTSAKREGVTKQDDKNRHSKHHDEVEFAHKLENAPIPSIHDGPKLLRSQDIGDFVRSRSRRHISQKDGLNPQRPHQKNEVTQQETTSGNGDGIFNQFHHPGHSSELTSNQPRNTYDYYKIGNINGSTFQYESNQTFKGYTETSNVGIIPPRGINAKNYYNSIIGLSQYPIIAKHTNGLSQSLYGNVDYPNYRYGNGSRDNVKNAYKNLLTGLAMWGILNGLVSGTRYKIYNHTNLPQEYSRNITLSNDTVVPCFEDATILCSFRSKPLCAKNGTTFCVRTSAPCDNCEDSQSEYLPCAANVNVSTRALDRENFSNTFESLDASDDVILCAITLVVPQKNNSSRPSCLGNSSCLETVQKNNEGNVIENGSHHKERSRNIWW